MWRRREAGGGPCRNAEGRLVGTVRLAQGGHILSWQRLAKVEGCSQCLAPESRVG